MSTIMSTANKGVYTPVREAEYDDEEDLSSNARTSHRWGAEKLSLTNIILLISNLVFTVLWFHSFRNGGASSKGCVRPQLVHCTYES
jgi:hypothetical protein